MAVVPKTARLFHIVTGAELERLRKIAHEVNERAGIVGDPNITAEQLQARMQAEGVRPEDNGASRELLRMRYGEDYEQEEE
jgi:hypothetical protein